MNNQAYDQKNSEDYEMNTLSINKALLEIEQDPKLKATIAQLSKMTGIHRNTITNRDWPIQKLKEIKDKRKLKDEESKNHMVVNEISLGEKLVLTQNEVIYWFNQYQDIKLSFENTNNQLKKLKESNNYYREMYEKHKKQVVLAELEIYRLKELLDTKGINPELLKH
jgi:mannose/fructose/N-acetylgalactosamine-specific phosphotransferase system component IIB